MPPGPCGIGERLRRMGLVQIAMGDGVTPSVPDEPGRLATDDGRRGVIAADAAVYSVPKLDEGFGCARRPLMAVRDQ